MTRLRIIHSPDFDRDLPDPGDEVVTTCDACGRECSPRQRTCDACHWGPQDDRTDPWEDEPDDAREPY